MSDFEDKVNSILNDPEQMEKIAGLAKSLMGGEGKEQPDAAGLFSSLAGGESPGFDPAMLGRLGRLLRAEAGQSREKQALFEAMKPYLSEKRRMKMDRAIKLAGLARIARLAMGEMGDKDV